MKSIKVAAGIIRDGNRVLATQRGYGDMKDGWEFPGGKIEAGESPQEALLREIEEELGVAIIIEDYFMTVEYDYPEFHLSMDCFLASVKAGEEIELKEHKAARWLAPEELGQVDWLPADSDIIRRLEAYYAEKGIR